MTKQDGDHLFAPIANKWLASGTDNDEKFNLIWKIYEQSQRTIHQSLVKAKRHSKITIIWAEFYENT